MLHFCSNTSTPNLSQLISRFSALKFEVPKAPYYATLGHLVPRMKRTRLLGEVGKLTFTFVELLGNTPQLH